MAGTHREPGHRPVGLRVHGRRLLVTAVVLLAALLTPAGAAVAAWSMSGAAARTYARADALALTAITPTAQLSGTDVTVNWTQNTFRAQFLGVRTYGGYRVNRYSAGGTLQTIGAGCAGVTSGGAASLSCTETSVPGGTWTYGITPVLGNWIGTESPRASVVTDTTAPLVTLSTPAAAGATNDTTPTLSGAAGNVFGDAATVTVKVYSGATATGSPVQTLTPTRTGATWTVDATALAAGTYTAQASQSDAVGNVGVSAANTFTLDVAAPSGVDVQTVNVTTVGTAELGDKLVYTFSEPMAPASILSGWSGSGTPVTVRLNANGTNADDTIEIWSSANTTQLKLGSVDLGTPTYTHLVQSVTFTGSAIVMSGSTVTVTLGTASGVVDTASAGGNDATFFMHWTPAAAATDLAGNPMSTTVVVETGSLAAGTRDREF
ncbi:MAG: hypothetical protein QOE01_1512 [Actinomycetota bacterium]|nr:hypothetical protein [Actinomycetota bacterium]